MTKICYLHLGFHKTGSTTLQKCLAKNRSFLLKQGINYPEFPNLYSESNDKLIQHSVPIYSTFSNNTHDYHVNRRFFGKDKKRIDEANNVYLSQLENELSKEYSIFLSGEDISLLSRNERSPLIELIKGHGYHIKPFALVRDPYEYICSIYQQLIKGGDYVPLLEGPKSPSRIDQDAPNKTINIPTISGRLQENIKCHENLKIISYEEVLNNSIGLVNAIAKEFNIACLPETDKQWENKSEPNIWVRSQNIINKVLVDNRNQPPASFASIPNNFNEKYLSHKFLLTRNEYEIIQDQIEEEAKALKELSGIDFNKSKTKALHSDPLSSSDWMFIFEKSLEIFAKR